MRDILTGLALLLIVALSVALAAPWFIDWSARRSLFEEQLSRLAGLPVTIGGDISVRLLPEPRITLARVKVGGPGTPEAGIERVTLVASVTPLLRGEVRIIDAVLENPIVTVTLDPSGAVAGSDAIAQAMESQSTTVAVERLIARGGRLTVVDPGAARPLSLDGIDIEADAASLAGPWRLNGRVVLDSTPVDIRLATGAPEPGAGTRLKLVAQVLDGQGRAEIDGRIQSAATGGTQFDGRLVAGGRVRWPDRDGSVNRPWTMAGLLRFSGRAGRLEGVELDAGGDDAPVKFTGRGELTGGATPRLALALEAKQLDLDRPFTGQGAAPPPPGTVAAAWLAAFAQDERGLLQRMPVSIDMKIGTVLLGGDAVSGITAGMAMAAVADPAGQRFRLEARATLPGAGAFSASGDASLAQGGQFSGRVTLAARDATRLSAWLEGERGARGGRISGVRDIDLQAEISASPAVLAARSLRLRADRSTLTGTVRFTPAEPASRGRFEAQLLSDGLSIEQVPDLSTLTGAASGLDLSVTLDARNVRVGSAGVGAGRLGIRFAVAQDGLTIENLDVVDVGGASVRATGRIGPAGGRLDATIDARRVEPLAELLRKVVPGRLPALLADRAGALGPLRLTLSAEKAGGMEGETRLTLEGTAAASRVALTGRIGGPQGVDRVTGTGRIEAPDSAAFLAQLGFPTVPLPGFGRGRVAVDLDGRFGGGATLRLAGDVAGTQVSGEGRLGQSPSDPDLLGSLALDGPDIGPLMQILGLPGPDLLSRLPASVKSQASLRGQTLAMTDLSGTFGGQPFKGRLSVDAEAGKMDGALAFDRLALPGLAGLALGPLQPPLPGGIWPANRFTAVSPPPFDSTVAVTAKILDLGGSWAGSDAALKLRWTAEALEISDVQAGFLGGRIGGSLALRRQGGLANAAARLTLQAIPLRALAPASGLVGTVDGEVDGAAAGETVSGLLSGLTGGGQLRFRSLVLPRLDPRALPAVTAALDAEKDPPDPRRVREAVAAGLDRGVFAAGALDVPLTLSAGVARIGPASLASNALSAQGTLALDLRTGRVDGRASLQAAAPPDWTGPVPQASLTWRTGRGGAIDREVDTSTLTNMLTTRAVSRELERIEAMESDLRERSFFTRRMKADRERLEREIREAEEARLAEEARIAEEARRVEEERRAEQARIAEAARRAEEARRAEIARAAEQARLAEERRQEAARRVEEARRAEEQARQEEGRRLEQARQEEARRLELARQEEARRLELVRQEELRRQEQARRDDAVPPAAASGTGADEAARILGIAPPPLPPPMSIPAAPGVVRQPLAP